MNKATYVTGIIVAAVLGTYFGLFGSLALDWVLPYNINSTNPFNGFVSDLRYWNYSMGTNEIFNLISRGPNTKNLKAEQSLNGTLPRYFSTSWFLKN